MKPDYLNVHLTAKELAKRLRKSESRLAAMRLDGSGPRYIPGRPVLYPVHEVEKWEAAQLVRSGSEHRATPVLPSVYSGLSRKILST